MICINCIKSTRTKSLLTYSCAIDIAVLFAISSLYNRKFLINMIVDIDVIWLYQQCSKTYTIYFNFFILVNCNTDKFIKKYDISCYHIFLLADLVLLTFFLCEP